MPSSTSTLNKTGRKPRTIALFFDNVGYFDLANSNVVKLYSILKKNKDEDQLVYYQPGVGASNYEPSPFPPYHQWVVPLLDRVFAWLLSDQIQGSYKFLMKTYNNGDKICLFGFSRGAYTARALAGMLHKVGLLPKHGTDKEVSAAYRYFKSPGSGNETLAREFKSRHCRNVPIDFIGVWDTIASVGLLVPPSLPPACVEVNTSTRIFRHALSLDEHRTRFHPSLCYNPHQPSASGVMKHGMDGMFETDIKEVWFTGCHSDIGGGATLDTAVQAMSNVPLRWMIQQIVVTNCDIIFDFDGFDRWGIPRVIGKPNYLSPSEGQGDPTSHELCRDIDNQDAVQGINDDLRKMPVWWIFEILPLPYVYKDGKGNWVTTWWPHLGRGRLVPPESLFHSSVKTRMDELNYNPKALYQKGTEYYVS